MTDQEFKTAMIQRFDTMDRKLDNIASQVGEVQIEIGAVKDRLTAVEHTVDALAFDAGIVPGRPEEKRAHA